MDHIVPPSLLFDFRLTVPACAGPSSRAAGRLLNLPDSARLFIPGAMNQQPNFATVCLGWNTDGLAVSVAVAGRKSALSGTSKDISRSDSILLWIDTRPAGSVHRATEYCHHFTCLPVDEHMDGKASVVVGAIAQQRAQRIESDPRRMLCRTHVKKDGYEFELWLPATQLYGFREIAELGRIGFYCVVQDRELGDQPLSVGDDFPVAFDPSTWIQMELQS